LNLLLIPTAMERDCLITAIEAHGVSGRDWLRSHHVELCGFGIAAASATTMRHIMMHHPKRVVLAGIAGAFLPHCPPGSACWFNQVLCDGIGVGTDHTLRSASEMGWNHLDADAAGIPIGDRIELEIPDQMMSTTNTYALVSGCAASIDQPSAQRRQARASNLVARTDSIESPIVVAEDMEGFGVAMACRIAGVPISIVRGISNCAGDRDFSGWKTAESLGAVATLLLNSSFLTCANS
jgi:futalosine hydrolase